MNLIGILQIYTLLLVITNKNVKKCLEMVSGARLGSKKCAWNAEQTAKKG